MIRKAEKYDSVVTAELAHLLWPDADRKELVDEFELLADSDDGAVFLAFEKNEPVGFAQMGLRHDYVEGCESNPVGYLEGIYVKAEYRGRGIARELLRACEDWARESGCHEFASDCELTNEESLRFHLNTGFRETNRIICFLKKLK